MNSIEFMKKLNQRKLRWILRQMEKGELFTYRIAKQQGVSGRWIRELYRRYKDTSMARVKITKCSRKRIPLTGIQEKTIMEIKTKYSDIGAVGLETILCKCLLLT